MQAPGRLWEGSVATIGEIAETYGEPSPVPEGRLVAEAELASRGIRVIPTPGHASHHVSFLHAGTLFAGEAIATRIPLDGGDDYLRPATPPRFLLNVFLESLDRLATLDPEPQMTAFAHWGLGEGCASWCRLAREQLLLWIAEIERLSQDGVEDLDAMFSRLRAVDPCLRHWDKLSADIQEREHYYAKNSLRGMLRYLAERGGDQNR
jgi:glyoxylase-like metal-dependent hydrolase (beta-lactamase superfamily II)